MPNNQEKKKIEDKVKQIFNRLPKNEKVKTTQQEILKDQLRKFVTTFWQIKSIYSVSLFYFHDFPKQLPNNIIQEYQEQKKNFKEEIVEDDSEIFLTGMSLFNYHDPITNEDIVKTLKEYDKFNDRESIGRGVIGFNLKHKDNFPKNVVFDLLKMKEELETKPKSIVNGLFNFDYVINSLHLVMLVGFLEAFIYECMKIVLYYDISNWDVVYEEIPKGIIYSKNKEKTEGIINYLLRNDKWTRRLEFIDDKLDIYTGLSEREFKFIKFVNLIRNIVLHKGGVIDEKFMYEYNQIDIGETINLPKLQKKDVGSIIDITDFILSRMLSIVITITHFMTLNIMKKYLGFEGIPDEEKLQKNF